MNVATLQRPAAAKPAASKLSIVDCDIHPTMRGKNELYPFLSERWRKHYDTYGSHVRQSLPGTQAYPRMQPATSREDTWPPNGGPPGSDLDFMREQHLGPNGVEIGILHAMRVGGYDQRNQDFGAALSSAINAWQLENWVRKEPRLRGSIHVPQDNAEAAVKEIEKRAGDRSFVQVTCAPLALEPLGRRRYWPIFEAAVAAKLPLGLHVGGMSGHAVTGGGWPSYYFEHHYTNVPSMEAVITSLVFEGVFERLPDFKLVLIEGGFSWVPSLCWRLDKHWAHMRDEVPHVKRPPSEYIRQQVWYTTQPIEEPPNPEDLRHTVDWLGWDRLLFSTDYPHWDYDDPATAIKIKLTEVQKEQLFRGNAKAVYGLS
jgi:predicted TIM-barrel fold metal-dependent hydrolase